MEQGTSIPTTWIILLLNNQKDDLQLYNIFSMLNYVQMFLGILDNIDPMHKWRQFKYSFVYIQISPISLILGNIFFWKCNSRTRLVGKISM